MEVMKEYDNYTEAEDELVSLLHLDSRRDLNRHRKLFSLDYNSLRDYIYRDGIPTVADNMTCNNEDEREEEDDLGEQS
jgi:hypothetical protein